MQFVVVVQSQNLRLKLFEFSFDNFNKIVEYAANYECNKEASLQSDKDIVVSNKNLNVNKCRKTHLDIRKGSPVLRIEIVVRKNSNANKNIKCYRCNF